MAVPLPQARALPRKILGDKIAQVVREQQQLSAAAAAGGAPPPPSAADVAAQAADIGAALERELFNAFGHPDPAKPGQAYADKFKTLAMGLPRNPPLVLILFAGHLPPAELVRYSSDDLVSDEAKAKAEAVRTHQ